MVGQEPAFKSYLNKMAKMGQAKRIGMIFSAMEQKGL